MATFFLTFQHDNARPSTRETVQLLTCETLSRLHRSSLICGQPTVLTWTR